MKVDALVIGSELDGWVAAARLLELGRNVCVVTVGEGSLHYAPGGLHVLGYANGDPTHHVAEPFQSMAQLDPRHPYRLAGEDSVRSSLAWFGDSPLGVGLADSGRDQRNSLAVTPAGLGLPVLIAQHDQATLEAIAGKAITVLAINGHRDFPWGLLVAELGRRGEQVDVVEIDPPGTRADTLAIARALDRHDEQDAWFKRLKSQLPDRTEVLLFPAVCGNQRSREAIAYVSEALGCTVLEVPTLPPCLPGARLNNLCRRHVTGHAGVVREGVRIAGMSTDADRVVSVQDEGGREIEASAVILATGGALMGGLTIDSHGAVHEPTLGLAVNQTSPLSEIHSEGAVDALHRAGIETDPSFRPCHDGSQAWQNLFVTGRNLAHWNPGAEISAEGVSIVSGWLAAESAHKVLDT